MFDTDANKKQRPTQEHSLGPWRVEPDLSNIGLAGVTTADGAEFALDGGYEPVYMRIADARLIAAAPELLSVAREAVRLYESYGLVAGDAPCGKWINATRDAIAKAEGR